MLGGPSSPLSLWPPLCLSPSVRVRDILCEREVWLVPVMLVDSGWVVDNCTKQDVHRRFPRVQMTSDEVRIWAAESAHPRVACSQTPLTQPRWTHKHAKNALYLSLRLQDRANWHPSALYLEESDHVNQVGPTKGIRGAEVKRVEENILMKGPYL